MSRSTLVIVPDEGAAEMVRAALVEAGVTPEFERVYPEHPYMATPLAERWRVFVPAADLQKAQDALARLEHDIADEADRQSRAWHGPWVRDRAPEADTADEAERDGRARRATQPPLPGHLADLLPRQRRKPGVMWALALAAIVPFPIVCFYAHARRLGAVFLGLFVASVGMALSGSLPNDGSRDRLADEAAPRAIHPALVAASSEDPDRPPPPTRPWLGQQLVALGLGAKLGDLVVGLGVLGLAKLRRRRAPAAASLGG